MAILAGIILLIVIGIAIAKLAGGSDRSLRPGEIERILEKDD